MFSHSLLSACVSQNGDLKNLLHFARSILFFFLQNTIHRKWVLITATIKGEEALNWHPCLLLFEWIFIFKKNRAKIEQFLIIQFRIPFHINPKR